MMRKRIQASGPTESVMAAQPSTGGMARHDLADEYKVSAERIRQIEVAAMKKMKKVLAAYA